jgi:hypothetical protein
MIDYRFNGRLTYIPGGALSVSPGAWPSAASNWWEPTTGSFTVVAAYQAKGAADLAASYTNLANPGTYDAAVIVAPTWDSTNGWIFTSAGAARLNTGIVPASGWSMFIRFSGASNASTYDLAGAQQGSTYIGVAPWSGGTKYFSNGSFINVGGGVASGVMGVAGQNPYLDGTDLGTIGTASWTGFTTVIHIGRRNGQPTSVNAYIQALAIYSTVLDATQVGEITTNMQAL